MSNGSAATRWWENYLVRYFLPSVAGMFIVRWLDLNSDDIIGFYIPLVSSDRGFDSVYLITWMLFGSLYCYIASYPVLVFHATRVLDFKSPAGDVNWNWMNPYFGAVVFVIVSYVSVWYESFCVAMFCVVFFSFMQVMRIYKAYSWREQFSFRSGYKISVVYAYLYKLSSRRGIKEKREAETKERRGVEEKKTCGTNSFPLSRINFREVKPISYFSRTSSSSAPENDVKDVEQTSEKISLQNLDLIESYRHLREHGNTAFILLLELGLCPVVFLAIKMQKAYNFPFVVVLLVVWSIPAVLVYFLAQHLERAYSLFSIDE